MVHAAQKLEAAGPRLGHPHSSAVRGAVGQGFRELRPRAGRSRWRPIYRRANPSTFVIFAVAPEAGIDSRGYDAAVARAVERFAQLELDWDSARTADNRGVIMKHMKLSEMKTNDELVAEQLRTDPDFRAEWERTALARAVAVAIVRYRTEHDLSQRELADHLGMKQPQVARLELGEVNPSIDTLMRISAQLGIEFTIDVRPAGTPARNVTKRAQANGLVGSYRTEQSEILVVADRSARLMNT